MLHQSSNRPPTVVKQIIFSPIGCLQMQDGVNTARKPIHPSSQSENPSYIEMSAYWIAEDMLSYRFVRLSKWFVDTTKFEKKHIVLCFGKTLGLVDIVSLGYHSLNMRGALLLAAKPEWHWSLLSSACNDFSKAEPCSPAHWDVSTYPDGQYSKSEPYSQPNNRMCPDGQKKFIANFLWRAAAGSNQQ